MITIELDDGSVKKFNFPEDKEQEFYNMWLKHKNKAVKLAGEEIKISEIMDCYIGEKVEVKKENYFGDDSLNILKDFFGLK